MIHFMYIHIVFILKTMLYMVYTYTCIFVGKHLICA